MAALLIPAPAHQPVPPRRPHLALVPPARPAAGRPGVPSAAVYRRRRVGAVLLLATLVVLADHGVNALVDAVRADTPPAAAVATPPAPPVAPVATQVVVVQPGDTVWSIARSLRPTGEIRPLVDELARRAGGSSLRAGQRLDVSGLTGTGG